MPVIAVVNRKGGSGKSTLAAHLAAWCAHQGHAVMLGDVDRQQSTRSWLRKRNETLPAIAPWTVDQNILRVPAGITHVILDTPGGLHGFELGPPPGRLVGFAPRLVESHQPLHSFSGARLDFVRVQNTDGLKEFPLRFVVSAHPGEAIT